jgi:predicted amino acid racemase
MSAYFPKGVMVVAVTSVDDYFSVSSVRGDIITLCIRTGIMYQRSCSYLFATCYRFMIATANMPFAISMIETEQQ